MTDLSQVDCRYSVVEVARMIQRGEVKVGAPAEIAALRLIAALEAFARIIGREP